jgi:hypothetical protein
VIGSLAFTPDSGMTSMALGLVQALRRDRVAVGFVKPIMQPDDRASAMARCSARSDIASSPIAPLPSALRRRNVPPISSKAPIEPLSRLEFSAMAASRAANMPHSKRDAALSKAASGAPTSLLLCNILVTPDSKPAFVSVIGVAVAAGH